jgi:hypothetical protein
MLEEALRYDIGTRNSYQQASIRGRNVGDRQAEPPPRPPIRQQQRSCETAQNNPSRDDRRPQRPTTIPSRNTGLRMKSSPVERQVEKIQGQTTAAQKSADVKCYECGQAGHIRPNCPRIKDRPRVAAARIEEIESVEKLTDLLEEEEPDCVNDPEERIEEDQPSQENSPEGNTGEWEEESPQYDWDDNEYDKSHTQSYRANAICVGSMEGQCEKVTLQEQGDEASPRIRIAAGAINRTIEPVYDHRARHKNSTCPKQTRAEKKTLSAFWEIEGVKAHCLLDSGCEGVMISSEFTRATNMRTFELECPIGLQLACIGSKSTINYGTNASIKIGTRTTDEYFDVANIDFYDAILGMPFLRRHGIVLDFKDQGKILIGNEAIPINFKVVKPEKEE